MVSAVTGKNTPVLPNGLSLTNRFQRPTVRPWALVSLATQVPSLGYWDQVSADEVPNPYRDLLVHDSLMTPGLERFYSQKATLRVVEESRQPDRYARKILLGTRGANRVVEFAIIRIEACRCAERFWDVLMEGKTPVGTILTQNNVQTRVQADTFIEVTPGPELMTHFKMNMPEVLYGRFATHYWEGEPAVQVLEILPPHRTAVTHAAEVTRLAS